MSTQPDIDEISENLELLDDWEERYRYLIELGQGLEPLSEDERTAENKVKGCVSQAWLVSSPQQESEQTRLVFRGDSDAMIVKGLVAVLIAVYSGKTARQISETDAIQILDDLGLREHLTSQRANGLVSMVQRIRDEGSALAH